MPPTSEVMAEASLATCGQGCCKSGTLAPLPRAELKRPPIAVTRITIVIRPLQKQYTTPPQHSQGSLSHDLRRGRQSSPCISLWALWMITLLRNKYSKSSKARSIHLQHPPLIRVLALPAHSIVGVRRGNPDHHKSTLRSLC